MGGTFDPIHMGHLILGEQSYEQFQLDKVLFMPSGNPPHKRDRAAKYTANCDAHLAGMIFQKHALVFLL